MNILNDWSVIALEDSALTKKLAVESILKRHITGRLGIPRTKEVEANSASKPPKYGRRQKEKSFAAFEPWLPAMLEEFPEVPAVILAENFGGVGSEYLFRKKVRGIHAECRPVDPVDRLL